MWDNWLQKKGETYDQSRKALYGRIGGATRQARSATSMKEWYRLFDDGLRSIRGFEHKGAGLPRQESETLRKDFLNDMFGTARPDRLDDFWNFPKQEGDSGLELDAWRLGMSVYGKKPGAMDNDPDPDFSRREPDDFPRPDLRDGWPASKLPGRRDALPEPPDQFDPDEVNGVRKAIVRWKNGKPPKAHIQLLAAPRGEGKAPGNGDDGSGTGQRENAQAATTATGGTIGGTLRPGGGAKEGPMQRAARTFLEGAGPGLFNAPAMPEAPKPAQPATPPAGGSAASGGASGTAAGTTPDASGTSPNAGQPHGNRNGLAAPDKPEDIQRMITDTLHALEGNELRAYIPMKNGKPMDKSGATIGAGIDTGQWSAKGLRKIGVDEEVITRLSPLLGKNAEAAQREMDNLKKTGDAVSLTPEQARHLNEKAQIHFSANTQQKYNTAPHNTDANGKTIRKFEELPKEMQAVITSVLYQHGSTEKVPKFWEHTTKGNWEGAINELRNFSPKPDYKYHPRRNKEADIMQKGLDRLRQ